MIDTSGYTVGSNYPLTNARILYAPLTGTVTGTGSNPDYAANDYTSQRWELVPGSNSWLLTASGNLDCVFIAAHNLSGKTIDIQTASVVGGPYTTRKSITPTDNSTICVLLNNAGTAYSVVEVKLVVSEGSDIAVGIIRVGAALQMPVSLYAGHRPLNLNRITEAQQQFSETGQWLGRIIKRRAVVSSYEWEHLSASWYGTYFEPFAKTLPLSPFCIAGNPSRFTDDVGFVWTDKDVEPSAMGVKDYWSVGISVTGYY